MSEMVRELKRLALWVPIHHHRALISRAACRMEKLELEVEQLQQAYRKMRPATFAGHSSHRDHRDLRGASGANCAACRRIYELRREADFLLHGSSVAQSAKTPTKVPPERQSGAQGQQ